ncbi:hypothetical protein OXIME_000326 [Oxyplasma meridianum]|uniref:Uncharacterized protein n=1 Tax=Oxyplasma meridianum TaxID=3073602 RepID=A0AAX4NFP2_9ARCH
MVKYLLDGGHEVIIGSSGKTEVEFNRNISYISQDRFHPLSVREKIGNLGYFDLVYDLLAYIVRDVKKVFTKDSIVHFLKMKAKEIADKHNKNLQSLEI